MFDILLSLPFFRGVSREKIAKILEVSKFHFLKYAAGETVVRAGDPCTHVMFIISGSVRCTVENADGRFRVAQTLERSNVIAPDFLFGRVTNYPNTVVAEETAGILQISKNDYLKILTSDQVFMLNFLNILSKNAQKSVVGILALTTGSIEERIALWITSLTQPDGKNIVLTCRQRDLYSFFGVQRSSFIAALDNMRDRGMITYTANEIAVVSRRELVNLLHRYSDGGE
ncbi:MAG: Crp/Fnr family transcriptional regulator [Muribaculaceae bacterium]|nr:Crp/Fnr family transcriptional regulator [Muribaculaceae bacterium]